MSRISRRDALAGLTAATAISLLPAFGQQLAELARRMGRAQDRDRLSGKADKLAQAIQTYCWDARDSYFYSVDVQCVDRRAELIPSVTRGMDMSWKSLPIRIQMFTGFLPLCCGIATKPQAEALVKANDAADDRLCGEDDRIAGG